MGWLSSFFDNPISTTWNTLAELPGTPEAGTTALEGGLNGTYSWNPYSPENSVWDVGAGGDRLSEDPNNRQMGRAVGTAIGSYFTGGALGAYAESAGMGATAASAAGQAGAGALFGGAQAGLTGGSVGQGALRGGLAGGGGSYLGGLAGDELGATNPYARGAVVGATNGAINADLNGQSIGQGAIRGGITGGVLNGLNSQGNTNMDGYQPTNGYSLLNDINQSSNVPSSGGYNFTGQDAPQMSTVPAYSATGGYGGAPNALPNPTPNNQNQNQNNQNSLMDSIRNSFQNGKFNPMGTGGGIGYGDLAGGLMQMYQANQQRKQASGMLGNITGMNNAYQTNMDNTLKAQYAAQGRLGDVGGRNVQLQAALAQLNANQAPMINNLHQQMNMGNYNSLAGLFQLGQRSGAFGNGNSYNTFTPMSNSYGTGGLGQMPSMPQIQNPDLSMGNTDSMPLGLQQFNKQYPGSN